LNGEQIDKYKKENEDNWAQARSRKTIIMQ
jgi:hypothetical protein